MNDNCPGCERCGTPLVAPEPRALEHLYSVWVDNTDIGTGWELVLSSGNPREAAAEWALLRSNGVYTTALLTPRRD